MHESILCVFGFENIYIEAVHMLKKIFKLGSRVVNYSYEFVVIESSIFYLGKYGRRIKD